MSNYNDHFAFEFPDQPENFEFQTFDHSSFQYSPNTFDNSPVPSYSSPYVTPNNIQQPSILNPTIVNNDQYTKDTHPLNDFDEPPLLDELEIYPSRILQKSLAVLNPFHAQGLADDPEYLFKGNDLAGPIMFCLTLAVCLFLSGNKVQFGYIYGLSVITVCGMWMLIKLMTTNPTSTTDDMVTITSVASILGYSILPIVWLSILGIFLSLNSKLGICLAGVAVFLSSAAASRIFCIMTGDENQRFLIAYPCSLIYIIFVLLVLF